MISRSDAPRRPARRRSRAVASLGTALGLLLALALPAVATAQYARVELPMPSRGPQKQAVETRSMSPGHEDLSSLGRRAGWSALFGDDFEQPDPAWRVGSNDPTTQWGLWNCWSTSGTTSAAAIAGGTSPRTCGQTYPNDLITFLVAGPFDLSTASIDSARILVNARIDTEAEFDYLQFNVTTSDLQYPSFGWAQYWGQGEGSIRLDLNSFVGQSQVFVWVAFESDGSVSRPDGVQIDDFQLQVHQQAPPNQAPTVTVTAPNGGEVHPAGSTQTIAWTASDPDGDALTIAVDRSLDGGSSWQAVASGLTNSGSTTWTVPSTATTTARVRVRASDGQLETVDTSDANFTIETVPVGDPVVLTLSNGQAPAGGEVDLTLSLQNDQVVGGLQFDLLVDPAVVEFVSASAATRTAGWTVEGSDRGSGRARVLVYSDAAVSLSAGTGAVATLRYRVIGAAGTSTAVTFADVVVSDADGRSVAVAPPGNGAIDVLAGGNVPPTVTVVAPNGGESLVAGSTAQIQWTASDADGDALTIDVEFSPNGGATWQSVASDVANSGSRTWTVPSTTTTDGRVRVIADDGTSTRTDTSDASFSIVSNSTVVLTVGSGSGASGSSTAISVALDNTVAVHGLQFDVAFDATVARFGGATTTARSSGWQAETNVLSTGRARVLLYDADGSGLAAGTGAVLELAFDLIGAANTTTAITPQDVVLADANGVSLSSATNAGSLSVGAAGVPVLTVAALRNPGVPHRLQLLVHVHQGSGNAPQVTVDGNAVSVAAVPGVTNTYQARAFVATRPGSVTIDATDTNAQGTGTRRVVLQYEE